MAKSKVNNEQTEESKVEEKKAEEPTTSETQTTDEVKELTYLEREKSAYEARQKVQIEHDKEIPAVIHAEDNRVHKKQVLSEETGESSESSENSENSGNGESSEPPADQTE